MKLAWATDIPLNFVDARGAGRFYASLEATGADAILLGGDIAEAKDVTSWLRALEARILQNLLVRTGVAEYGVPQAQDFVLEIA